MSTQPLHSMGMSRLPSQFPCLVRAIYSYAGDSKGDLGFVQGDLIECLNAGDGQWWFGRLKRNKTMGVFPSNYVELVEDRPSSKGSSDVSRPPSSHSQMRPTSRNADCKSQRSFQLFGHDLNAQPRPSSSESHRNSQLHSARSVTSMSQYSDNYPRYSGRSPSPAFYSVNDRYETADDYDDDLHYPIDPIQYSTNHLRHQLGDDQPYPRPRSPGGMAQSMRQTPSPLRWAMQDLMDSLDTMSPQIPSTPAIFPSQTNPTTRYIQLEAPYEQLDGPIGETQGRDELLQSFGDSHILGDISPQYTYPFHMHPPPILNYVDKMESRLERPQNYQPPREEFISGYEHDDRPLSRLSNSSVARPGSAYSIHKPLPASPSVCPPIPPPHCSRHRETESITSQSTKYSRFSSIPSDYSSATSSGSNVSAGSAGSFAQKRLQQRREEVESIQHRTALSVLPKGSSNNVNSVNGLLRRRKSYGASLKKTIGKLLNTSPSKPVPGSVTDHGGKIIEWQNARRDVNRANTPSVQERTEHRERLELAEGTEIIRPFEILQRIIEGDESANGTPILPEEGFDISKVNFALIDRATRLVNQIPSQYSTSPAAFARSVICRPYSSEIQRLRAIFVFLSEKFTWEPLHASDVAETELNHDALSRLFETRRGTSEDLAWCFWEMCQTCSIHAEVIAGHLKAPFNDVDIEIIPQRNHFWNSVIVNGEWRMIDVSLASPTHPLRPPPLTKSCDSFYFLARPSEFLYTHIPLGSADQLHVLAHEEIHSSVQLALPYACPAYFQNDLALQTDFDIALTKLSELQVGCIDIEVPEDVECVAEVESQMYARDPEGDLFESGEVRRDPALAQPLWLDQGQRRVYRVKGFLNGEDSRGTLKIFAGKKGLMTSALDNPYRLALTIPLSQNGVNPPFRFVTRHPTPHAQRHDLYVRQPQCKDLRIDQTYIFSIIQSPSAIALTETSKPAKLAIQTPGGKLIKLSNRVENDNGAWEALVKCGEKGSWKGLVLGATARWCVFAEWECQA